ncbi:serine/threonine protein kinase [Paenibacillus hamazuiensis]|uniref:serine/threonine protein kinase n=1 Tax=Paenibacillus hamazuiensis TaxID=2936508 RepID=UPI00200CCE11|nr:serine/threonine-protein kinase [Paenibacillus hamazuiensis]
MPRLQPGAVLAGRYRMVRVLGVGGMSTVYLADDLKLKGKRWAVKEQRHDARDLGRIKAEAEMLVRLDHVHLPHIVDFFPPDADGCSYLVMDYIEGMTLLEWFERCGRQAPAEQVAAYALQLCELLHYLHEGRREAIVYRDLKPSNVMIDGSGHVKLVDFGIARSYKADSAADTMQIGTIGFAAPEQFKGAQTDARSDLYSLGAMMYFLLSGGQHYYTARKSLRHLKPSLPEALCAAVDKLLREDPAERFQSAREAKRALERWRPGPGGSDPASRAAPAEAAAAPKLIVVGALYAGAGATFTAVALSKALAAGTGGCAVIERSAGEPELFAQLFGEKRAPGGYSFYTDEDGGAGPVWEEDGIAWYPARPDAGERPEWGAERRLRLFYRMKKPFIVADIGTDWLSPEAKELIEEADAALAVFDPLVYKLESPEAALRLSEIRSLREAGKPVHYIANKAVRTGGRSEWLSLMPEPASCVLPAIDFAAVVEACWQGELVHDKPEISRRLAAALRPLTALWLTPNSGGKPIWPRWAGIPRLYGKMVRSRT